MNMSCFLSRWFSVITGSYYAPACRKHQTNPRSVTQPVGQCRMRWRVGVLGIISFGTRQSSLYCWLRTSGFWSLTSL